VQRSFVVEESDEDMDGGKGNADDEVEEDEIVESDVELEGETVEPDCDPPQKVFFLFKSNRISNCIVIFLVCLCRIDGGSNVFADGSSISRGHRGEP